MRLTSHFRTWRGRASTRAAPGRAARRPEPRPDQMASKLDDPRGQTRGFAINFRQTSSANSPYLTLSYPKCRFSLENYDGRPMRTEPKRLVELDEKQATSFATFVHTHVRNARRGTKPPDRQGETSEQRGHSAPFRRLRAGARGRSRVFDRGVGAWPARTSLPSGRRMRYRNGARSRSPCAVADAGRTHRGQGSRRAGPPDRRVRAAGLQDAHARRRAGRRLAAASRPAGARAPCEPLPREPA